MFKIRNRSIGLNEAPFIVAEMSGNHNKSLDNALNIVDAAASAGAHAIKIQTYKPEAMTIDLNTNEFFISDTDSLWSGSSLYELYEVAHTPWEWHKPIFDRAQQQGLIAFSTPFDATAVALLEELDAPCYKISSFECTDIPLIKNVAATGKPVIISTGMATVAEISESVTAAREAGCNNIVLLKCTSNYPASPENSNIVTLPHLRELFRCEVGLSDHTMGIGASIAAVSHGASIIEKHFTLNRSDGGIDSAFSLEPDELQLLVEESYTAWQSLGEVAYGPGPEDTKSLDYRRSIYIVQDMREGDVLTPDNIRCIRPGKGMAPKYYDALLGKRVNRDIERGTPASWDLIV